MKKLLVIIGVICAGYFIYHYFSSCDKNVQESGWISLFDGKTFDGWHLYQSDEITDEWQIEDGILVFNPQKGNTDGLKNLVTDKTFTNFKLSLDWKISKAGNSGIFWSVYESPEYSVPYLTGPEIQILDNLEHPDREDESHRAGALYDMIIPSKNAVKEVGEWNNCVIEINHKTNSGKVWLNDIHIISFPVNGPKWDEMVSKSKFKDWEGFGKYQTGRIGLQDHGDKVSFRNIKIKEL